VPLTLVGFEAWENIRIVRKRDKAPWVGNYKWPIYFFVAVAFWNMVGAGFFGFLINPPVSLYYVQGLNLTPVHAHTALFGVYGMLGLGLTLFCLRAVRPGAEWKDGPLKVSFWLLNLGLALMSVLSMFPIGILQAIASIQTGTWYARSAEFMQRPEMQTMRWMRVPGDVIFSIGAVILGLFVIGLITGHSYVDPGTREAAIAVERQEVLVTGD
jgi:nitric oxide reductase subunit B